ncbi:ABC transporter ATP-binding protein [Cryobacterium melibiosiphilum]|uniref:ABC transporter ATP-binding protein n=1 Tax=Cryobacterium melibiosiphilum TaxID=995039 RepID=UPI001F1E5B52|nr:ABC transporter ATP-binding protein [Cryobacterium melibiosiphilum]
MSIPTAATLTRTERQADIRINGLAKSYGLPGHEVLAMSDVTLDVASGEFVAVVGASGCGKSTLLRILAGFEKPSTGSVLVGGTPVTGPGSDRGVVFQDYGLFPWLTVRENVAYGPRQHGVSRRAARETADEFLALVGLTRSAGKFPGQLSGGMQQRVAIARVLANNPAVLLMDEPFGALDALTRTDLQAELRRIHRANAATVLFVTHSIEEAVYLADRVVVMTGGAAHGVPGHIRQIVPVNLGDNRDPSSSEFNAVKRMIADLVHEGSDHV